MRKRDEEEEGKSDGTAEDNEEPLHLKISLDIEKFKKNNIDSANKVNLNISTLSDFNQEQPTIINKKFLDMNSKIRESAEAEKLLQSVKNDIEKLTLKMSSHNYFASLGS